MNYYMGIDIGTFESKGIIMNQMGEIVVSDKEPHEMGHPFPGYAEHDAESVWWWDFCKISKVLLEKTGISPKDIKGVGASAIGPCCLPLDENGKPLRKAILYGVDVRAKEQISRLNEELGEDYILERYGNPLTTQSIGPKILWIKENEPEVFHKTKKFVTASTYLVAKLTDKYYIDHYTAAYFTPMYHLEARDWDYAHLGRFCKKEQLAECRWTDEIAGGVTKRAALETGLAAGTPVIVGTADAAADAVGAGVLHSGDMLAMFGSSLYMIHIVPKLTVDRRYWAGPYLFKDTYMVASGMSTSGTVTRWFRDELAPDLVQLEEAAGKNAYDSLGESIADIAPGSDGLLVLPYFSGERTPIHDPEAKGMFFGMTLNHTRAHLFQACLESIAYGIKQHLIGYEEMGMHTERIIAVGGGTKMPKWMQIVSDVTGRKLLIGDVFGASYGDALLAAKATGQMKDLAEMKSLIGHQGKISPDGTRTKMYQKYVRLYVELYERTKGIMHQLPGKEE